MKHNMVSSSTVLQEILAEFAHKNLTYGLKTNTIGNAGLTTAAQMPAYHSAYNGASAKQACGCALLPLRTTVRGPAPLLPQGQPDIIDEVLDYFRANVLFSNFEIKGSADRLLVYGTLYTQQCLKRLEKAPSKRDGARILAQLAAEQFALPGDAGFPVTGMIPEAKSIDEKESFKAYLKQFREELGRRLTDLVYPSEDARSKWWMFFAKRKFMNKELRP